MVRFKNRYMVFELEFKDRKTDESLGEITLLNEFRRAVEDLFGQFSLGTMLASLQVKYLNQVAGICILRCSTKEYRKVWMALTLLTEMRKRTVAIRLLKLSGRIESVKAFVRDAVKASQQGKKCSPEHQKLLEHAAERLEAVEL